jgi:dTDP-4-amino-4,6-dideoxygalactose transaminase
MSNSISISLSPNTEWDDVRLAMRLFFCPWQWKKGNTPQTLELEFSSQLKLGPCFSFNSGRSCLLTALEAIGIKNGDEVIVQSFTCNAVINPILKLEALPVYVDIAEDLNIDIHKIEEKITSRTKVLIVQHTFGMPCQIDAIKEICKNHNLILIEDCAHALGAKINNDYCGSFGDFSFFSFGRDKVISSVYGGMLCVNNSKFLEKTKEIYQRTEWPSLAWIGQQILHPILTNLLILPLYNIFIGKAIMALAINFNILSKSVTDDENKGKLPSYFPKKMPNGLAILALHQIHKLERYNNHRRELALYYTQELAHNSDFELVYKNVSQEVLPVYLKFPLFCKNKKIKEKLMAKMKAQNVYLNDGWRDSAIMPPTTELSKMQYLSGSCLRAEKLSQEIIYLPTHIRVSKKDAEKIVCLLKNKTN